MASVVRLLWVLVLLAAAAAAAACGAENRRGTTPTSSPTTLARSVPAGQGVEGVVTSGGAPVEGAVVAPRSLDSPSRSIPEIAVLTDEQGHYVWSLPPGSYEIQITADQYGPARMRVSVVAGQVSTLDFALER